MNNEFANAVERIAEAVMFENWMRFYFISEEGEALFLRLPEKAMEQLQKRYASLYGLAEYLNNAEISHEASLKAVCMFVSGGLDGRALPESLTLKVFDSPAFHLELQLFGSWVQAHEEKLDERFLEFSQWREMYSAWKDTDEVRQYRQKLEEDQAFAAAEVSQTVQ